MAKVIKTTGESYELHPQNGKDFKLDEIQSVIGGYFEVIYMEDDEIMLVNEEARLLDLLVNTKASELLGFFVYGNVLICKEWEVL